MKINSKLTALLVASGALAVAVPAAAHNGPSSHPSGKSSAHTHRCAPHRVAYIVSGVITDVTSGVTQDPTGGTWSGTVNYTVKHHNHWAKNDPGTANLSAVKVTFQNGATDFTAPNTVKLIGKIEWVRTKGHNTCPSPGAQGAPTFRKAIVSAPTS